MQSLNEIMPKRYQIKKNGCVIMEGSDLGNMVHLFVSYPNDGYYQVVCSETNEVVAEKGASK